MPAASALTVAPVAIVAPSSVSIGIDFPLTASVQNSTGPVATGTITVRDGATVTATGALNAGGSALFMLRLRTAGGHAFVASYSGDGTYAASDSSPFVITGERARTQIQLVAVSGPSGKVEALQASVIADAGIATGSVTFAEGAAPLSTASLGSTGVGFFFTVALSSGNHSITAAYAGDASCAPSTSAAVTVQIGPGQSTTEIVSMEPRQVQYGQPVNLRVRVSATPPPSTGTVTIRDGLAFVTTAVLDQTGQSTVVLPLLSVGGHSIIASFAGNSAAAASTSSPASLSVVKAYTSATASASPATIMRGQSVTLTARVDTSTGVPNGTVSFKADGTTLATVGLIGQRASAIVSFESDGQKGIVAAYNGDTNFESSTAVTTVKVATPVVSLRSSASSVQAGDAVTLTAQVSGAAAGSMDWFDGAKPLATTAVDGAGLSMLTVRSLDEGQHLFSVAFSIAGAIPVRSAVVPVQAAGPVQTRFVTVSAASGAAIIAPDSIASAFGVGLAAADAQPQTAVLPLELGGVTLRIEDSAGQSTAASLSYVSPTQVNFVVPSTAAAGPAKLTLSNGTAIFTSTVHVDSVAPAIFTADGSGSGAPAAVIVTAHSDGTSESRLAFTCVSGTCSSSPIDMGSASDRSVLVLYGTGIRNADLQTVSVRIAQTGAPVVYAGKQPEFPGLDQVNVVLPASLAGAGEVALQLTAAGKSANTVKLKFQ